MVLNIIAIAVPCAALLFAAFLCLLDGGYLK